MASAISSLMSSAFGTSRVGTGGRGRRRHQHVPSSPASAHDLLRRNLLLYGLGGLVLPFLGIKAIDLVVSMVPGLG
ncbi:hypothetical protein [Streptomyces sp. NPDC002825]|uniref:hypothetical protein n=1 Tax=Streptomyces sp. NPDC002825 TaxID=3154666 RepID=UPI0033289148